MIKRLRHCAAVAVLGLLALAGPAGAQVQTARINGAHIAYRDLNRFARGVPLVMITGYGSTMAEWDPSLIARLARHRRLILLDNRGIGRSTGSVRGLTIRRMANDASGLIRALRQRRVDVLGWSMGGFIAQELALDNPGLVRRLILASTDPGSPHTVTGSPSVIRVLTNPATTPTELFPILFPADQQVRANTWFRSIVSQPGVTGADFAVPATTAAAQKAATTTGWLHAKEGSYARLPKLTALTLVAYGTRDVIVPAANAQLLLHRLPHARGVRMTDAGHAFLFQDPITSAAAFHHFLNQPPA
jgi:pimeloyl-ACP methyl ester carboxylesterase